MSYCKLSDGCGFLETGQNSYEVLFRKRNCFKKEKPKLNRNLLRRALRGKILKKDSAKLGQLFERKN